MILWYIQMTVSMILWVMAAIGTWRSGDGKRFGLWIARRMMRPIERERAAMAALDQALPEAIGPHAGDYTYWRYVPMMGTWPVDTPPLDLWIARCRGEL